jgi:hypothetical protein
MKKIMSSRKQARRCIKGILMTKAKRSEGREARRVSDDKGREKGEGREGGQGGGGREGPSMNVFNALYTIAFQGM